MSENCTHDCSSCGENCSSRSQNPADFIEKLNPKSRVNKTIGIVSGKGGVGKSLVTSLLAVTARRAGLDTAVLDADVTGPSIPKVFGLSGMAESTEEAVLPMKTATGIDVMSINLLLHEDIMFIDMPPGTGDVPLTVFQSIPLDGIVVVTSPQELVGMIVEKAVNMAHMMNIPVLGIVENMSYVTCPDCGRKIYPFGESHVKELAAKHGIGVCASLPIDPIVAMLSDEGKIEAVQMDGLEDIFAAIKALPDNYKK